MTLEIMTLKLGVRDTECTLQSEIVETTFVVSRLNEKQLLSDAILGILKSFPLSRVASLAKLSK